MMAVLVVLAMLVVLALALCLCSAERAAEGNGEELLW